MLAGGSGSTLNVYIHVQKPSIGEVIGSVPSPGVEEVCDAIIAARAAESHGNACFLVSVANIPARWYGPGNGGSPPTWRTIDEGNRASRKTTGEVKLNTVRSFIRRFCRRSEPESTAKRLTRDPKPNLLARRMFVQREALGVVGVITPWESSDWRCWPAKSCRGPCSWMHRCCC